MPKGQFTRPTLIGQRFNRLTVIEIVKTHKGKRIWKCLCECGNVLQVPTCHLKSGHTKSCGCFNSESVTKRNYKHGRALRKAYSREYVAWTNAKSRCFNSKNQDYKSYGGRGITMCSEWAYSFSAFLSHVGSCPDGYTIERKDVNGNYEPGNVEWIPAEQQQRNTRKNRLFTLNGETHCISEWERIKGIKAGVLHSRISRGWSTEKALTVPLGRWPK